MGTKKLQGSCVGLLKVLADETRLAVVRQLLDKPKHVNEINAFLQLEQSLLSHHLRVLRKAGLITSRRDAIDGRWIYYAVDKEAVAQWRTRFAEFLDPARIQDRTLCGPEGQQTAAEPSLVSCQTY